VSGSACAAARPASRRRRECGQASVELVGLLPLAFVVALAIGQLLAAGAARELAGHAAEAGAVAMLQGGDAKAAARDALPGWADDHLTIAVRERTVRVRLQPITVVPGLSDRLTATVVADAGPKA
jgi:hypothetical protein